MTRLSFPGLGLILLTLSSNLLSLVHASLPTCSSPSAAPKPPAPFLTTSLHIPDGTLTLAMNSTTSPPTNTLANTTLNRAGTVMHNGSPLYTYNLTLLPDGKLLTTILWTSAMASGAMNATLIVAPDNSTTGFIDGKALAPFKLGPSLDATTLLFADGTKTKPLLPPTGIEKAHLTALTSQLSTTLSPLSACLPDIVNATSGATEIARSLDIRGLDRYQDPGHFSDTYGAAPCVACKTAAYVAEGIALAGCTVACIFSFGSACAVCYAGAGAGVVIALEGCEHSSFCCPSSCGRGGIISPGTCCFGDEPCLDHAGRCCRADQVPCVGKTCCNADQSCIQSGPAKGTCCPDTATQCGGLCCPGDTDQCVGNTCCAPSNICGGVCCPQQAVGLFPAMYCADPAKSVCCFQNEVNVGGICCPKGQNNCGGKCCAGRCAGGNQCVMTSSDCLKNRGNGDVCTNEGGWCESGFALCKSGCCIPQPK